MNQSTSTIPDHVRQRRLRVPPVPVRRRTGRASALTIACILDDFSFQCLEPEADLVPLTMRDWRVELSAAQPDMLLIESAWRGFRESWWNTVHRCGPEVLGILEWCKERGIPTAFWNKEDPVHFGTFLNLASRFDVVFTTDVDCVPRYKARLGHERVHFLPFAAQPVLHNPAELFDRIDGCAFAGAYYAKYPERNRALDDFSSMLSQEGRFEVYDRNLGRSDPDYAFPERYRESIVGGLAPIDIHVAYKGYTKNLNLNSVQHSQSMFARRVFELLASNTAVVSNFARGLRLLFADLVVTAGSANEVQRRLAALESSPDGLVRLRHQGLRKVLAEHTYAERLGSVAEHCGLPLAPEREIIPVILVEVATRDAMQRVRAQVQLQGLERWHLIAWGRGTEAPVGTHPLIRIARDRSDALELLTQLGATHVGAWDTDDWYGPAYLSDLVATLRWADVRAVGHAERWALRDEAPLRLDQGSAWTMRHGIALSRGLIELAGLDALPDAFSGLAVGTLEYFEAGSGAAEDILEPARSLQLDEGMPLQRLRNYADALDPEAELADDDSAVDIEVLLDGLESAPGVSIRRPAGSAMEVSADVPVGEHRYLYSRLTLGLEVLPEAPERIGHFTISPGLDVMLVFLYLDASGKRLGNTILPNARNIELSVPEGTERVRVGLRVAGSGTSRLEHFSRVARTPAAQPVLLHADTLVLTNIYPSYERLYRNGFVASRVHAYSARGLATEVGVVDDSVAAPTFREYRGVDVVAASSRVLASSLRAGQVSRVLVHFLDRSMLAALRSARGLRSVTVWVHGFEIQPWHRRAFQFSTDAELEAAKARSDSRTAMWRELFEQPPANWHFVFVSSFLAEQAFDDIGARLPEDRFSIVHNPIDTELFVPRPKAAEDRYRVLSVRPYSSNVYANDLAVEAVLALQASRPDFARFRFAFYGDGPLFDEITAPLSGLENVELHRRFLSQEEIAEQHRRYGVFLTPSRMDTQGVSRGEAMASGLVPVASAIAAVPEFVDEASGVLVPPEDAAALAAAMAALADDPERFLRLSEGAVKRVHAQLRADRIVDQEIDIVLRGSSAVG